MQTHIPTIELDLPAGSLPMNMKNILSWTEMFYFSPWNARQRVLRAAVVWTLPRPGGSLPKYQRCLWRLVELIDGRVAAASDAWKSAESFFFPQESQRTPGPVDNSIQISFSNSRRCQTE